MTYISVVFQVSTGDQSWSSFSLVQGKNKDKIACHLSVVFLPVSLSGTSLFLGRTAFMLLFSPYKMFGCKYSFF